MSAYENVQRHAPQGVIHVGSDTCGLCLHVETVWPWEVGLANWRYTYMLTDSTKRQSLMAYYGKSQLPLFDMVLRKLPAIPLRIKPGSLNPLGLSPTCMQQD